jgi:hypothetical protein
MSLLCYDCSDTVVASRPDTRDHSDFSLPQLFVVVLVRNRMLVCRLFSFFFWRTKLARSNFLRFLNQVKLVSLCQVEDLKQLTLHVPRSNLLIDSC